MKKLLYSLLVLTLLILGVYKIKKGGLNFSNETGDAIDSLNHVVVYYNGDVSHVQGRTVVDGYNVGLKHQCVEFVKRYYLEHYNHKMPDSYGHAKSFYQTHLSDGKVNKQRNLTQYNNPSKTSPKIGDLIVFEGSTFNKYGHVAIISNVSEKTIEIIQQNPGPYAPSRENIKLNSKDGKFKIEGKRILGWLRK